MTALRDAATVPDLTADDLRAVVSARLAELDAASSPPPPLPRPPEDLRGALLQLLAAHPRITRGAAARSLAISANAVHWLLADLTAAGRISRRSAFAGNYGHVHTWEVHDDEAEVRRLREQRELEAATADERAEAARQAKREDAARRDRKRRRNGRFTPGANARTVSGRPEYV